MSAKTDAPLPYYKWLWQDWRSNRTVQRMGYVERGLYRELLDECWVEGSIPSDVAAMADICDCPVDVMATAWQVLAKCFILLDGRYHNEKLDSLRTERDAVRVKRVTAGRLGGIRKALNQNETVANASQVLGVAGVCHIEEERRVEKKEEHSPSDSSPAEASDQKRLARESIPYQQVADAYNEQCKDLFPNIVRLTDKRKRAIKIRWLADVTNPKPEQQTNNVEYWKRYFAYCMNLDFFLKAAKGELTGAHSGWIPNFDFMMTEKCWINACEGTYQ